MSETEQIGVRAMIVKLLSSNEQLKGPMTDPEITEALAEAFGDKPYFHNVSNLRCLYNSGRLTGGKKPKRKSKRYNSHGRRMRPHSRYAATTRTST